MATITMEVPDDVLAKLANSGGDVNAILRLAAAFSLCSRRELSTSQAARLGGVTYAQFLGTAAPAQIELFPVRVDELTEEVNRGFTLGRQRLANHPPGQGGTR
jgi:hypothetical protein